MWRGAPAESRNAKLEARCDGMQPPRMSGSTIRFPQFAQRGRPVRPACSRAWSTQCRVEEHGGVGVQLTKADIDVFENFARPIRPNQVGLDPVGQAISSSRIVRCVAMCVVSSVPGPLARARPARCAARSRATGRCLPVSAGGGEHWPFGVLVAVMSGSLQPW